MHAHHVLEILDGHFQERAIAQDAGVVDQDVERTKVVDSALHHAPSGFGIGDIAEVRHRFPSGRANLFCHLLGGSGRSSAPIRRGAQIVHHHFSSARRQHHGVAPSHAIACTGNQSHPTIESNHVLCRMITEQAASSNPSEPPPFCCSANSAFFTWRGPASSRNCVTNS